MVEITRDSDAALVADLRDQVRRLVDAGNALDAEAWDHCQAMMGSSDMLFCACTNWLDAVQRLEPGEDGG